MYGSHPAGWLPFCMAGQRWIVMGKLNETRDEGRCAMGDRDLDRRCQGMGRARNIVLGLVALAFMVVAPLLCTQLLVWLLGVWSQVTADPDLQYRMINALLGDANLFTGSVYVTMAAIVVPWALAYRMRAHGRRALAPAADPLAARGVPDGRFIIAALLFAFGMQAVTTLIMATVLALLPEQMDYYLELVESSGIADYGVAWVVATIVLPPLVEELGFRGLGMGYLLRARVPFALANVVQALAFAAFHMNVVQGVYTFVVGLVLGYLAYKSRSVIPAMAMHAGYNLMGTWGVGALAEVLPEPELVILVGGALALGYAFRWTRRASRDLAAMPSARAAGEGAAGPSEQGSRAFEDSGPVESADQDVDGPFVS